VAWHAWQQFSADYIGEDSFDDSYYVLHLRPMRQRKIASFPIIIGPNTNEPSYVVRAGDLFNSL